MEAFCIALVPPLYVPPSIFSICPVLYTEIALSDDISLSSSPIIFKVPRLAILSIPVVVSAGSYNVVDMTVDIDDNKYLVLTPDNIDDSEVLKEKGIKCLIFDLDNTLGLISNKNCPEETKKLIKNLISSLNVDRTRTIF